MTRAALIVVLFARAATGALLADSMSVSGDSISRGFDANTSACNYGDNVSRNWATGDDHGSNYCAAAGTTFSHAERLECAKGGDITNFNHAASGADMLSDFFNQSQAIKLALAAAPGPHYVPVFMGHNDICTNTTSKTGNSCSGDDDPNNYCRTTNAAFEREFRRGMDQLIQIPSSRIGVSALVRVSELCNFTGKSGCGLIFFGNCQDVWGLVDICASLTVDCSNQRRLDAYNTAVGYNEILERVTNEYIAIPSGGLSATGATKAPDVQIRYSEGAFNFKFSSGDVSCCDCFHPSDVGQSKISQFGWDGLQCSASTPCCGTSGDPLTDARCDVVDTTTFYPSGFWPGGMPCGNGILDPMEQCDDGNTYDGDCCSSTCQFEASGAGCANDGNACTNDVCDGAGACTHPNNTVPCNDGQFCTVNDACAGGACTGTPRDCSGAGNQCNLGVCNEATDQCEAQPLANNTPCTDGNACTQTDTCQGGSCTGTNPVVCNPLDQCHDAGTCNTLSGVCSNPAKPNGSACSDNDACTQSDTCQGGACTGANPVVCTPLDQCHDAGTCNALTGTCSDPAKPDGTGCTDNNACTQSDTCQGGACSGTNPVVCTPLDQCHDAGTCDSLSGTCSNPTKPDGTTCDDGQACTLGDVCTGGACSGGPSCGDGVVQSGCGETCDDGPANGTDQCCSATCALVDADGDQLCDAIDPCTGGVAFTSTKVTIGRQTTPPGDDSLNWRGELILPFPFSPALDPATNGIRILLANGTTTILDATIPGGLTTGSPPVGWKVAGNGAKWTYSNHSTTPANGITKAVVQRVASTPGRLKFSVKGKNASLPPGVGNPPLGAVLVLDPPVAVTGQCGEGVIPCTSSGSGNTRRCR
jgi:cysteine-rich repeat protein